ncbi:MAG TPA: SDR family NAD(P)-dependent oxidoreductase [Candidatus Methanoperedens sp.]|nr:SDR family NAD(P)-dependent oxidoreductase [Candidatus Methanoperedens sp.]
MGGRQIKEGLKLGEHFADQVVSQVDFVALVRAVAVECELLVEVGPGTVLTGLAQSILGPQGLPALPVESRPGRDRDLNTLLAQFFVRGGHVHWEALYEDRLVRPFVPASARVFIENPCERTLGVVTSKGGVPSLAPSDPLEAIIDKVPREGRLSPHAWSAYLAQRGDFLRELVQADLKHFSFTETPAAGGQAKPAPAIAEEPPREDTGSGTPKSSAEIEELLLTLVVARTGFPRETLSLEMRLLDDLNLDSIKAGAIIADAAAQVGVAGEVDPVDLVNSSLQDLARRLQSTLQEREKGPEEAPPATQESRWVRDYVLVGVERPLSFSLPELRWDQARVLLLHDRSEREVALALQACFEQRGAVVTPLSFKETNRLQPEDLTKLTCYITLLPRRQSSDTPLPKRLPGMIARLQCLAGFPLVADAGRGRITAAYVQFGGGAFGFGGDAGLEQCAAKALAASLHLERPDLRVRVIDLSPRLELAQSGELIIREIEAPGDWEAAGYDEQGVRRVTRARLRDRTAYTPRAISWSKDDVVLVTGGGKGISAECALAFAGATGVRMALVGSSPHPASGAGLPAAAVAQTLERFEHAGIDCRYFACDISDERAVASLVVKISAEMGRITGVIHGAAKNVPRSFSRVSRQDAFDEVSPKVLGAWNLGRVLGDTGLKLFVGMSSVIGVTGMARSAWYGFSNEALDLVLAEFSRQHPETAVISLAFSVWDEVGMGVRLGSLPHLKRMGVGPIGVRDGVESFLRLTREDAGSTRVVIASLLGGLDTWRLEPPVRPAAQRFLEEILFDDPGRELVARARLSVQRDPYLNDHVWHGSVLFPTVFGLEAMAQAAAQLRGLRELPPLCLEDIQLERPIVVPQDDSLTIELRARVQEGNPDRVRVAIFSEQTGFSKEHFAATFCFDFDGRARVEPLAPPPQPLPIEPRRDLYGGLLFQGPLFQRIRIVHTLVEKRALIECNRKLYPLPRHGGHDSESQADSFLLGDPFFSDALLQSCQLVAAQDECLPVQIDRIELFRPGPFEISGLLVSTTLDRTHHQKHFCTVTATDQNGRVVERLQGCALRILSHHDERPTTSELANPADRDRRILRETLQGIRDELGVPPPAMEVSFLPGLHQIPKERRHEVELPAMERAVQSAMGGKGEFGIDWTDSGQPVVRVPEGLELGISVTHDTQYLLAVAGVGAQGCDLEVIQELEEDRWPGLLGKSRSGLLSELVAQGDERQIAGTRLWCVSEAWRKATGSVPDELRIVSRSGGTVIFGGTSSGDLAVLTFTVSLTFGPPRVVACVFQQARRVSTQRDPSARVQRRTAADYGYDGRIFSLDVDVGPQGQAVYVQRFPATFRHFQNCSRSIYFSAYFQWMGEIREYSLHPVMRRLYPLAATGGWGLATNSSEIRIFGDLQAHEIVESRLWMEREVGDQGATFDWLFEWSRVPPEGGKRRIALSRMRMTWIQIVGHGVAHPQGMPDFLDEFIGAMKPTTADANEPISLHDLQDTGPGLGRLVTRISAGPAVGPVLYEETFKTTLEDSNLIGNVYFATYALWQGRVRDQYFYSLAPRFYRGNGEEGELRSRWVKIDHIREAMPFDHVRVSMHLQALHEHGAELKFEYNRVNPGEQGVKLASSTHEVFWIVPGPDGRLASAVLPEEFRRALLEHAGGCQTG